MGFGDSSLSDSEARDLKSEHLPSDRKQTVGVSISKAAAGARMPFLSVFPEIVCQSIDELGCYTRPN